MSTGRHIDLICAVITALALVLTVLFMNGEALGLEVLADGDAGDGYFTDNDLDGGWTDGAAETITLTGSGASVSGGAYFTGGTLYIVSAGRYILTGSLTGGIVVEAGSSDKIWLGLDGVTVENPDGPAIDVEEAEKVFLTLMEGTENYLSSLAFTDGASGADGAVYSRDDLTVNGSGSLTVKSAGHGIVGNDDLVITGGSIDITAAVDGIHANDSVRICNASITVNAGDDGVTVSNDERTGYFYMESGKLDIPSCYEGVEGQQITVAGGEISVLPTDDGFNATETGSAISITGGSVRVVNETGRDADGFDSNGSIYISGGYVFISVSDSGGCAALDAGTESGGVCEISGGTVIAAGSGTMAESFDASSAQGFIARSVRGSAGAAVTLTDGSGNTLIDETVPCAFSHIILSSPSLETGDTVTLSVDGAAEQLTVDNSSAASSGFGGFGGGMFGGMFGGNTTGGRGGASGQSGPQNRPGDQDQSGEMPESGESNGDASDMTPPDGSTTPPQGGPDGTMPDMGGTAPDMGGTMPDTGGNTQDSGGTMPDMGGTRPDSDGTMPEMGGTVPGSDGTVPDMGGTRPDSDRTMPDTGGTAPDLGGAEDNSGFGGRGEGRFPNGGQGGAAAGGNAFGAEIPSGDAPDLSALILTLISALALAAGIFIAFKVRH